MRYESWQGGCWRRLLPALVLLGSACFPGVGSAGSITLNTTGSVEVGDEIKVSARVVNQGDEAAYEVRPQFTAGRGTVAGKMVEVLAPHEPHTWQASLGQRPDKPGRYAVKLRIDYRDSNSYQFSALVMLAAAVGEAEPGDVVASIEPASLNPGGQMRVTVTNRGREARRVTFFVDTPREILAEVPISTFALEPAGSRKVTVPLRSAGALAGSSYAVFARLEYDTAAKHYSEFFASTAKVEATRAAPYRRWLILAAVILAAAALVLQLRRGRPGG